jgi:hypothetical protein
MVELVDWRYWSQGWLREGDYLSYVADGITYYERVLMRDWAHYVYALPSIAAGETTEGNIPDDMEVTRGYDERTHLNYIWQVIFGIKGEAYIYVQLPTDVKRHGTAKKPWHSKEKRDVAHFEEWMSPFHEPSFVTEHFLKRPETYRISFDGYNPQSITVTPELNFIIAKLVTERVGTEAYTEAGLELKVTQPRWEEILKKLYQRQIPCRPITILPVRMPAAAPSGE